MAVDIMLVLASEHRRMTQLVQRCGRTSRGFHDPRRDLHIILKAHLQAAATEVYPSVARRAKDLAWPAQRIDSLREALEHEQPAEVLAAIADEIRHIEQSVVVPTVCERLELQSRRRLGKIFRIKRDAHLRTLKKGPRRQLSQTELYEVARRAQVEHRSRMTATELQAAINARGIKA